jgi:hypothetical protein
MDSGSYEKWPETKIVGNGNEILVGKVEAE